MTSTEIYDGMNMRIVMQVIRTLFSRLQELFNCFDLHTGRQTAIQCLLYLIPICWQKCTEVNFQSNMQHMFKITVLVQTSGTQLMHRILPASSSTEKNIHAM